jgi:hypothetical protein
VVISYPALALKLSNLSAFGGFFEVYRGTNLMTYSRVHYFFATNFSDRVHLSGVAAEKFLRERAGANYAPDLLLVGRE